jgi:hypothetical protein
MGELAQGMRISSLATDFVWIPGSDSGKACRDRNPPNLADRDVRVFPPTELMESAIGYLASVSADRRTARAVNAPTANGFQCDAAIFVKITAR